MVRASFSNTPGWWDKAGRFNLTGSPGSVIPRRAWDVSQDRSFPTKAI